MRSARPTRRPSPRACARGSSSARSSRRQPPRGWPPTTRSSSASTTRAARSSSTSSARSCGYKSIRELVSGPAGVVVRDLKPIWLMSPLSVADTLPLEAAFDVVDLRRGQPDPARGGGALRSTARAQCIVVGDESSCRRRASSRRRPTATIAEDDADAIDGHRPRARCRQLAHARRLARCRRRCSAGTTAAATRR